MANTTITVNVAESQNYLATSKTISVNSVIVLTDITVVPSQNGRLTQTSSYQSPTWNNYNSSQLTIGGTTSGKNAGKYSATFTPKSAYQWSSAIQSEYSVSAQGAITVDWYIIGYGVYGVKWTTNVSKGTRTQDAVGLADPVPALSNTSGSSPFDYIYPWCDIKRVLIDCTDFSYSKIMLRIPKFWYKITYDANHYPNIEISATSKSGYSVSPAHRNRDGNGERDYVYIENQEEAVVRASIATMRTLINRDFGEYGFQTDYAMYITLLLLFTVEMAYTEAGSCIGIGGVDALVNQNYHTSTTASSRSTAGAIRYRYFTWWRCRTPLDGIYFTNEKIYSIDNPKNYRSYASSNGRLVGTATQPSSMYFNAIQSPYSGDDSYILFPYGGFVVGAKVYEHGSFTLAPDTSNTLIFNTVATSGSFEKYCSTINLEAQNKDQTGSSSSPFGKRAEFTPPNNYANITSIEVLD